jgi:hypothetical protein
MIPWRYGSMALKGVQDTGSQETIVIAGFWFSQE